MAGRGRLPRHMVERHRGYPEGPDGLYMHGPLPEGRFVHGPIPHLPHPSALEEEIELQHREIRRLFAENRAMTEDRVGFQRELVVSKEELHCLSVAIADIRAEKDAHIRELIERGLKLEADLRAIEPMRNEAVKLRAEVQKLNAVRQDLAAQVQKLTQDLARAEAENKQISRLRNEIKNLRNELMRARTALEFEKKGNGELQEQRQTMEKNLVSMAHELEKLRAELGSSNGRPWGPGGAYGMKLNNPEGAFQSSFGEGYSIPPGDTEKPPFLGASSGSWGAIDKSHVPRR